MYHLYAAARLRLVAIGILLLFIHQTVQAEKPDPAPRKAITPEYMQIEFEMIGKLIYISAEVDGIQGGFILDTGAPGLVLNSKHFKPEVASASLGFEGVTGGASAGGTYFVGQFDWLDLQIRNFETETLDLAHLEKRKKREILGLMGNEIFKGYEMEIDYEKQVIHLYLLNKDGERLSRKHKRPAYKGSTDFRLRRNIPVITAYLGATPLAFVLDTGSELTILRDDAKDAIARNFIPGARLRLASTGDREASVETGKLENLSLGSKVWKPLQTLLVDMSGASKAYSGKLDGILGYEFLSSQRVSLNYVSREIYFWESTEEV